MKNLKYFFAICLLSSLFLTSCTKENPLDVQVLDDSQLMLDLYQSDAVIGTGVEKEDNKFAYSVKYNDLPNDLKDRLATKKEINLENDLEISGEIASRIWGDKIVGTAIENGFTIPKANRKVVKKYMTPDGVDITQDVADNPELLSGLRDDIDIFAYWYEELEITIIGPFVIIGYYYEECIVVVF